MAQNERNTVLVVDDSVDTNRMLSDVLETEDMTVLVALGGAQALMITRNITPDIILLDALMPNMDGFETCRQLKLNPMLADVPIIFMTGLTDTEHVVMGFSVGGVDYVSKPIKPDELVARMRVHLANARMARQARIALDRAGQYLFAVTRTGELLWATPQVHKDLQKAGIEFSENRGSLAGVLVDWLARNPEPGHQLPVLDDAHGIRLEFLAQVSSDEILLRLVQVRPQSDATDLLREQFELTAREADVLLWIANGKTNREIGQILEMSPRTVNKHLEQVFRKLGVENRTSAAAVAIRLLGGLY